MLNIYKEKKIDFNNFIKLAIQNNFYINQNLFVKRKTNWDYGIFTKKQINPCEKLISIPKNYLISYKVMKDFILGKKVEYPNLELLKNYFLTIPSYNHFKNKSIIFINDNQKKEILDFFVEKYPTRKNLQLFFDSINKLDDVDKYLELIFKSRSFNFDNSYCLAPILDMVNYKSREFKPYINNENELYLKNKNVLKSNDEFFHGYESHNDIISFYLNYNFIPNDFNRILIKPNFFFIKIPGKQSKNLNEKYWFLNNGYFSNKINIIFEDYKIPLDLKLEISKIAPNKNDQNKIIGSILDLKKNEVRFEKIKLFLKKNNTNTIIRNFVSVLETNHRILTKTIDNINRS